MVVYRLDPWKNLKSIHFPPRGNFLVAGASADGFQLGFAGGVDSPPGLMQLKIPRPITDSTEFALAVICTTSFLEGNDTRFFNIYFEHHDGNESTTTESDPVDMDWLDGIFLTFDGYPDTITLGSGGYDRTFDVPTGQTRYSKLVLDASIALFNVGQRYAITWPGSP